MSFQEHTGSAGRFIQDTAAGAGRFLCRLWVGYPDQWTKNKGLGGGNMVESFFQNFCPENPPPPEPPPFTGGQCPTNYTVRNRCNLVYRQGSFDAPPFNAVVEYIFYNVPGPITTTYYGFPPSSTFGGNSTPKIMGDDYIIISSEVPGGNYIAYSYNTVETNSIINVVRSDGLPDNCGSLPTSYPTSNPPAPGDEKYDVDITNPTGGPSFTLPLIWNDVDFNFPITFKVENNPEINIEVNFDGTDINFGPSPTSPDGTPKFVGPGSNPVYSPSDNPEFSDRLPPPPINLIDYDGTPGEPTEEEEKEDAEITFVKLDVTVLPIKDKRILMPNPDDTVLFAGYFCWIVDGARTIEYSVRKLHTVWIKPSWATGYAFYAVNGAQITATSYKKKTA